MIPFLLLNILTVLFLIAVILETRKTIHVLNQTRAIKKIPAPFLLVFIVIAFTLAVSFLIFGRHELVSWYIRGVFAALMLGHAAFLSIGEPKRNRVIFFSIAFLIMALRFLYPNETTHNLLVLTSFIWIGPLFTKVKLLTKRRFVIISIIWFLYDIFFVWLSPIANTLVEKTAGIGFPLAITIGKTFIGSGDLLWANLFVSILKENKTRITAIIVLIGSNVLYGWFGYEIGITGIFPLLVLWVPLGLCLLHLSRQFVVNRGTSKNEINNKNR